MGACLVGPASGGVSQHRATEWRHPKPCRSISIRLLERRADTLASVSTEAKRLRFLVVEDTEDIRDLMVRMVVREGHLADQAVDGAEAVAALESDFYDVMLLDLSMPRMSGEDVVRWLNEHPDRAVGLRIVVVTAWAGERRAVLQELGVTDVVQKPLRAQQLRDLIAETNAPTSR